MRTDASGQEIKIVDNFFPHIYVKLKPRNNVKQDLISTFSLSKA